MLQSLVDRASPLARDKGLRGCARCATTTTGGAAPTRPLQPSAAASASANLGPGASPGPKSGKAGSSPRGAGSQGGTKTGKAKRSSADALQLALRRMAYWRERAGALECALETDRARLADVERALHATRAEAGAARRGHQLHGMPGAGSDCLADLAVDKDSSLTGIGPLIGSGDSGASDGSAAARGMFHVAAIAAAMAAGRQPPPAAEVAALHAQATKAQVAPQGWRAWIAATWEGGKGCVVVQQDVQQDQLEEDQQEEDQQEEDQQEEDQQKEEDQQEQDASHGQDSLQGMHQQQTSVARDAADLEALDEADVLIDHHESDTVDVAPETPELTAPALDNDNDDNAAEAPVLTSGEMIDLLGDWGDSPVVDQQPADEPDPVCEPVAADPVAPTTPNEQQPYTSPFGSSKKKKKSRRKR
jgi:hypothetical protein